MAKLIWTHQAKSDLSIIAQFIAADSALHAKLTVRKLYNAAQLLRKHPFMGRIVPEIMQENIRELLEGNYRIIYQIDKQKRILILTIHHSAKKLKNKFI